MEGVEYVQILVGVISRQDDLGLMGAECGPCGLGGLDEADISGVVQDIDEDAQHVWCDQREAAG